MRIVWTKAELRSVAMRFGVRDAEGKPYGEEEVRRLLDYSQECLPEDRRKAYANSGRIYTLAGQLREEYKIALAEPGEMLKAAILAAKPTPAPAVFLPTFDNSHSPYKAGLKLKAIVTDAAAIKDREPVQAPISTILETKLRSLIPEITAAVSGAVVGSFMTEVYPHMMAEMAQQMDDRFAELKLQMDQPRLSVPLGASVSVSGDAKGLGFGSGQKPKVLVVGAENRHHRFIQDKLDGYEVVTCKGTPVSVVKYQLVVILKNFTDKEIRRQVFEKRGQIPVVTVPGEVVSTVEAVKAHFQGLEDGTAH